MFSRNLEVGEDVRDAEALLDDHVVDGCAYYAEVPRHAVRGEAAQEVVPEVIGVLPGDLLEGDILYLVPTVDLHHILSKSRNTLPDFPLGGGCIALEGRILPQGCVEGNLILLKPSGIYLLYHSLG